MKKIKVKFNKLIAIFMYAMIITFLFGCSSDAESDSVDVAEIYDLGEETEEPLLEIDSIDKGLGNAEIIEMTFSNEELCQKHYTEVEENLRDLGFTNIEYDITAMDPNDEEQFDGCVLAVYIDKEQEFDEGTTFDSKASIIISYVEYQGIVVPKSSAECENLNYKDAVQIFEDAGFTNVQVIGMEVEYTDQVTDGSVVRVSVNDSDMFDENTLFDKNVPIIVYYRIIKAQETKSEASTQTETPSGNNEHMVWIPTKGGKKYHTHAGCSNMDGPDYVTLDEAQRLGFTACKRCH